MRSKKLKVLQVFGSLNMGGAESRMMDIYRNIDRNICDFDFLTMQTDDGQYYENEINSLGGNVIKIDSPRKSGIFKHIVTLYKILKKGNYDAVHAHTSYHCGVVTMVAFFAGVKVRISHARTAGSKQKSKFKGVFLLLGRCLVNLFSTHKFAVADESGKFLFGNKKFEVVPNAIDTNKYLDVSIEEIGKLKSELNISKDKTVIGQIGRFDPMKNHQFTINWFSKFLKDNPDSILIFVGDGPLRRDIQQQCEILGIKQNVIFTGVRGDVPKLIHCFNVLIVPSIYEGLPGVVLESQICNVPAVVSNNITKEIDLGINMVTRCSLQASFAEWSKAILKSISYRKASKDDRLQAFDNKGYSIKAVTKRFVDTYGEK